MLSCQESHVKSNNSLGCDSFFYNMCIEDALYHEDLLVTTSLFKSRTYVRRDSPQIHVEQGWGRRLSNNALEKAEGNLGFQAKETWLTLEDFTKWFQIEEQRVEMGSECSCKSIYGKISIIGRWHMRHMWYNYCNQGLGSWSSRLMGPKQWQKQWPDDNSFVRQRLIGQDWPGVIPT